MEPDIAYLGNDFEEAAELQKSLLQVLDQLKSKQSPVEDLLRKADELIIDQKPNAGVYSAMVMYSYQYHIALREFEMKLQRPSKRPLQN